MHGTLPSPWASAGARFRAEAERARMQMRSQNERMLRQAALRTCFDLSCQRSIARLIGMAIQRQIAEAMLPMMATLDRIVSDVAAIGHYASYPRYGVVR